jgi:trimethylamine--corrinoid protein Co-methyltransferase
MEAGAPDATTRAYQKVKELLKSYEAPEIDPAVDEALIAFMEQRKAELS